MTCNAFVLGGGGVLGAAEVGMARALLEAGVHPDLVCGTSVGAINGAAIAADPTPEGAQHLLAIWDALAEEGVLDGTLIRRVAEVLRRRTSLHGNGALRRMLRDRLPAQTFEDLAVPFECVAARIERAREHWFSTGDLIEPVLASCALPGVFPPVRIGDEHFFDGGLVNSIPLDRAVALGAETVWVLHVGRLEEELAAPRFLWEGAFVSFEIPRRHRFHSDLERVGSDIVVHVLPTGLPQRRAETWSNLRYRDPPRTPRNRPARRAGLRRDPRISQGLAMTVLRRFVTVPLVSALMVCVLVAAPLLLAVSGLAGLAARSSRPVRTVALAMAYAFIELRTLVKLALGNLDCDRLMGDFLTTAYAAVRRILDVEVVLDPSSTTPEEIPHHEPVIVLSRHCGPGIACWWPG